MSAATVMDGITTGLRRYTPSTRSGKPATGSEAGAAKDGYGELHHGLRNRQHRSFIVGEGVSRFASL